MSYEGWTNYETWNVSLWLGNDEGSEEMCRELSRRSCRAALDRDAAVGNMARDLKDFIEEMTPDLGASMFSDLLRGALSEVDWYEIAEHYIAGDWAE